MKVTELPAGISQLALRQLSVWTSTSTPGGAPIATPPAILERLADVTQRSMRKPAFRDRMFEPRGILPFDLKLDAFRKFLSEDRTIAARLLKEAGVEAIAEGDLPLCHVRLQDDARFPWLA